MRLRAGFIAVTLVALLSLGVASVAPRPDEWAALVATGDRLAATGGTVTTEAGPLSARAAYLLAFHHAQDALDVERMLVAAERLDRLDQAGEDHLAARLRAMTRHVALNDPVPPPPTTPGPHTLHNPQYLVDKPTSQALPSPGRE
ncbi:MAG TPA: hypothetical protein VJB36_13665 [Methylomirabilota bacterium]|nr:hypothetical protein [Methylomirabilota bacterium]